MAAVPVVRLRRHGVLEAVGGDDELVTVGVGPAGQVVALWTWPDEPRGVRITTHDPGRQAAVEVPELAVAHSLVQPLAGDHLLVVGARCEWRPEGPEHNATVIDADGSWVTTGTLGDGIEDVRTTTAGDLWVGYFDEGVYGNLGWGDPGGPEPIGHPGLIRWTADLDQAWRHPYGSEFGVIDDCYALNIDGDTAWACYYSAYPIIRIDGDVIDGWHNAVAGARALLADPLSKAVALVGGYGPEHDRVTAGRLANREFEPTFVGRLTYDDGSQLDGRTRLIGRGPELNAFRGTTWYKLDLADIVPTPGDHRHAT